MFDDFSKRAKAVRAALGLVQQNDWGDISLDDIASAANLSLADLRHEFSCKSDILRAFQAGVDAEVLSKAKAASAEQSPRDRLFDIIMTRFEVLAPYKPALKRISTHLRRHPGDAAVVACSTLASQYWMLTGAGTKLDGPGAALRVGGLTALYGQVFQTWLDDPSPSLDKTMAALDRRLRSGEQWLERVESVCESFCRLACAFVPRGWRRDGSEKPSTPPSGSEPSPAPGVH
jgi:AcrR family transcriptional regulator